ncbi:MAG: hypothetical protein R3D25_05850 [Geminicoccaceae bacterium]
MGFTTYRRPRPTAATTFERPEIFQLIEKHSNAKECLLVRLVEDDPKAKPGASLESHIRIIMLAIGRRVDAPIRIARSARMATRHITTNLRILLASVANQNEIALGEWSTRPRWPSVGCCARQSQT